MSSCLETTGIFDELNPLLCISRSMHKADKKVQIVLS